MIDRIVKKLNYSGNFFRFSSPDTRNFYSAMRHLVNFNTVKNRKYIGENIVEKIKPLDISKETSYLFLDPYSLPHSKEMVNHANDIFNEQTEESLSNVINSKVHLPIVKAGEVLKSNNPFIKFALDPLILSTVSNYLGMFPVLSNIHLWYSPNDKVNKGTSQEFHLDHADVSQVKIFIAVDDIDEDSGPLLIIDSSSSEKLTRNIDYKLSNSKKRVDDKVIEEILGDSIIKPVIGPRGSISLIDSCKCLHAGSRKSKKPRKIIMIQYLSPFAFQYPLLGLSKVVPFKDLKIRNRIAKFALGQLN